MILDNSLVFDNFVALTASRVSTNAIDLTGAGSGVAPKLVWGVSTTFGQDLGIGDGEAIPQITIQTGPGTPGAATSLNIQFQGAIDNGSNVAGSYTTYIETGLILLASITASKRLARFAWPMRQIAAAMPRFVQLNYVVAGSSFTGLTVFAAVALQTQDNEGPFYPNNFVVAA